MRVRLDSRPGDAVLIAPVSKQIPWYQGILQGILRFWGSETRFSAKKSLRGSHLSSNSLRKLTGKMLQVTGNFYRLTGNFTANIARLA
jgi:hypothetical protein